LPVIRRQRMRKRQYPIDTAIEKFVDLGIVIFERLAERNAARTFTRPEALISSNISRRD
jgi:hypothetical protein